MLHAHYFESLPKKWKLQSYTIILALDIFPEDLWHPTEGGAEKQKSCGEPVMELEPEIINLYFGIFRGFKKTAQTNKST